MNKDKLGSLANGMGDEKVDKTDIEAEENAGQPPEDVLTEASPADSDPEEAAAVTEIGELETRVAALTDQLLRAQAETENVRRRSARDVENAHKFALEKFASELLPVVDTLPRFSTLTVELWLPVPPLPPREMDADFPLVSPSCPEKELLSAKPPLPPPPPTLCAMMP